MTNNKNMQVFDDDSFDLNWDFADEQETKEIKEKEQSEKSDDLKDLEDTDGLAEQEDAEDAEFDLDGADEFGTEIDLSTATMSAEEAEELEDAGYSVMSAGNNFIDDNGNVIVMDNDNPEDEKRFEFIMLPIEKISIAEDRIRLGNNFESLYKSVKSTGLLEPIIVAPTKTDGYYILLHGFRRLQACAKCGMKVIPTIINHRVKTSDIPILEALYNHNTGYKMKELEKYITYLENDKNIMNASLIEYLTQWNNGDYNKFKDLKEDDDPDIYGKLLEDQLTIAQAFKNLENRRKKESKDEKELKVTAKAYAAETDKNQTGLDTLKDVGETAGIDDVQLSNDEVQELLIDPTKLDEDISDKSLDEMVAEGKQMEGFEDHKQDWRDRERIDPAIRKAVMSRDNNTCQCCKRGGPDYVDILDLHHIVEVYLGGVDSVDNGIALCLNCHKQVHLYAQNKLHIPKTKTPEELDLEIKQMMLKENADREKKGKPVMTSEQEQEFIEQRQSVYKEEQDKYKRIINLGNIIRKGLQMKGKKLEDYKKEHPIDKIGRQKPGEKNTIA